MSKSKIGINDAKSGLLIAGTVAAISGGAYLIFKALKPIGEGGKNAGEIVKETTETVKDVITGVGDTISNVITNPKPTEPKPTEYAPANKSMKLILISTTSNAELPKWQQMLLPLAAAKSYRTATLKLVDSATGAGIMGAEVSAQFQNQVLRIISLLSKSIQSTNSEGIVGFQWQSFKGQADNMNITARKAGYNPVMLTVV
jgi:hypothetical protein